VRVLLDEQLPRQLVPHLLPHDVRTVQQERWAGLKNGELLKRAKAAGFEALLTADQSLEFQQNLVNSGLSVVVIIAVTNALEDLIPVVPMVLAALSEAVAGRVVRVGVDR